MKAKKVLNEKIILELLSLVTLLFCTVFAINSLYVTNSSNIESNNKFIAASDVSEYNPRLEILSDGEGLSNGGIIYSVTNNNSVGREYSILIKPNTKDKNVINNLKVSVDDLYIFDLSKLEKKDDYYILYNYYLDSKYTKRHVIKSWYKLDAEEYSDKEINFDIKLNVN